LVGFELYSRILKDAVQELRRREQRSVLELPAAPQGPKWTRRCALVFRAHSEDYVPDIGERLLLYQRLTQLEGERKEVRFAEDSRTASAICRMMW